MYSATTVRQFDPHDPRYYQCCCAARIHVASMAKAIACICIVSNILSIFWPRPAILHGTTFMSVAVSLIGSVVMAAAIFQEHRPTLIVLLMMQGLCISIIGLLVFLFVIALFLKAGMSKVFVEIGALMLVLAIYQICLLLLSFGVNLHFYTFLSDRERAGALNYQYRTEHQPQYHQQQPSSSRGAPVRVYREQPQKPSRPVNEDHISYPIYPVKRTPSITPSRSPSIVPSAPLAPAFDGHPVPDDTPPPSYESLEEQQNKENDERE